MNSTLRHYALWFFGALTLTLTPLLQGQTKRPLDLETVTYGGKTFRSDFYPQPVYGLAWLQSGYTYTVEPGDYGREGLSSLRSLRVYTPTRAQEQTVLTQGELVQLLKPYDDTDKLYPLIAYDFTPQCHYLEVELSKGLYLIDVEQKLIVGYFATGDTEKRASLLSPNERNLAVKSEEGTLLIYTLQPAGSKPQAPTLVATDEAEAAVVYGESVHQNEFGIDGGLFWSPDSRQLAFYRMDQSMVAPYPIVDMTPHKAVVQPVRYPMAGSPSHHVTLGVFHLENQQTTYLETGGDPEHYLTNVAWHPNSQKVYIAELNRGQDHLFLNGYDVQTGARTETLFEETDAHYVEPQRPMMFVPGSRGEQFVWESRREGYRQLYLYSSTGKLIRKLTDMEGEVTDIYGFDPKGERIYFQAAYPSPLERHIFASELKRGRTIQLSKVAGTHEATFSPDKQYYIDQLQSATIARSVMLHDCNGLQLRLIHQAPDPWRKLDMPNITVGTLLAADGKTELYYRLITPSHFDEMKEYPTIVYVYGGPHAQLVTNTPQWGASGWDLYMAQQGYIIFTLDNRGSAQRGAAFEQVIHRQVGTAEMADQMKGVEYLKSLPYVDRNRIGVYGWSFGGFMTTNLILTHPETFKVGVAGGPVMDWSRYEIMYGERYNDAPQDNPEGYQKNNLIERAKDLKGRLLLIHGTSDNVVVWQHAQAFVKACVDAKTYPDLYYYPGHKHNVIGPDRVHLNYVITRYFLEHL
ncbi:peptidase, S9A/B/C family, catalytic domain protein [Porphyromonas uenonis 60-3]|uniref:Peptidase, S9A/B/C family, catalytic domain protein n=1 Tax=Porphyromonas uenonis 60-3 TaxID=596327 RepID=C2MBZ1_9PORP|nr:S9 family peptidase [Porphyromonas uenonis]EEK16748.1 peptidase, S9A/B/C family, catalytic domain protein [Porphyromonas uenonis 60-3]